MLLQGLTLAPFIKLMRLPVDHSLDGGLVLARRKMVEAGDAWLGHVAEQGNEPGAILERVRGHYARKTQLELDLGGDGQDRATAETAGSSMGSWPRGAVRRCHSATNGSSTTRCSAVSSASSISKSFGSRPTRRSPGSGARVGKNLGRRRSRSNAPIRRRSTACGAPSRRMAARRSSAAGCATAGASRGRSSPRRCRVSSVTRIARLPRVSSRRCRRW
jgi:hypothetical protein